MVRKTIPVINTKYCFQYYNNGFINRFNVCLCRRESHTNNEQITLRSERCLAKEVYASQLVRL